MDTTTLRTARTRIAKLSLFAFALLLTLIGLAGTPLSTAAAAPSFGVGGSSATVTPTRGSSSSSGSFGTGNPASHSTQTIVLTDLGVVKVVSIKGLDQDQADQHLQDLHDRAAWTVTEDGTLAFTPGDASNFPEIDGEIATKAGKDGSYAYKAQYVGQADDGSYVAVALTGTLFQQKGHTYLQVDEQLGSGTSKSNLKVGAELQYYIEVAVPNAA